MSKDWAGGWREDVGARLSRRAPTSRLLAVHEDLPANFFELLEEHAQDLNEVPELSQRQLCFPFSPEAQEDTGCVWPYGAQPDSDVVAFSHDVFAFCRSVPAGRKTEGGGPVKRFLTTRQKCLFPTAWFKRY